MNELNVEWFTKIPQIRIKEIKMTFIKGNKEKISYSLLMSCSGKNTL